MIKQTIRAGILLAAFGFAAPALADDTQQPEGKCTATHAGAVKSSFSGVMPAPELKDKCYILQKPDGKICINGLDVKQTGEQVEPVKVNGKYQLRWNCP